MKKKNVIKIIQQSEPLPKQYGLNLDFIVDLCDALLSGTVTWEKKEWVAI